MCSLQQYNPKSAKPNKWGHICGATLLSGPPRKTIIVSAAHCYNKKKQYQIVCGEHHLDDDDGTEVNLEVESVTVHPNYQSGLAHVHGFDIAVFHIKDDTQLKLNKKKIYPICLPDWKLNEDYFGDTVTAAGWGMTKFGSRRRIQARGLAKIARHVNVEVIECEDYDNADFPDGLICAASKYKDSCQGDSGGPLMAVGRKSRKRTELVWVGIVSYGVGCALEGYPGAYTRTSCYLDWIAETVGLEATGSTTAAESSDWETPCPADANPGRRFNPWRPNLRQWPINI